MKKFEDLLSNYLKPRPMTRFGGGFTVLEINYNTKSINVKRFPNHEFNTYFIINYLEAKSTTDETVPWLTLTTEDFEENYRNTKFDYINTPIDDDYFNLLLAFREDNNFLEEAINFLEKELLLC